MQFKCFYGIRWATGIKPTIIAKHRTNKGLIKSYNRYEREAHFDTNLSQCFSNDCLNTSGGTPSASFRAKTTISMPVIICCWILKLSLTVLLITFLWTAFLIIFLAIAKPTLGLSKSLCMAKSVKYRSVDLTGLEKTFLNSAAFFNLNPGGKP